MRHKQIHYATGAVILLLLAANIFQWRRSAACRNDVRVKEQLIADIGVNTQSVSFLESNWQWNLTAERSDLAQLQWGATSRWGRLYGNRCWYSGSVRSTARSVSLLVCGNWEHLRGTIPSSWHNTMTTTHLKSGCG